MICPSDLVPISPDDVDDAAAIAADTLSSARESGGRPTRVWTEVRRTSLHRTAPPGVED